MNERLSGEELSALVQRVFQPDANDTALAILIDLPDERSPDTTAWQQRRVMAADWAEKLQGDARWKTHLYLYRNVGLSNADLPELAHQHRDGPLPSGAEQLALETAEPMANIFANHSILLAPTQFSATAPLKLAAKQYGFRAATMPGFRPTMIPALRLDYTEINRRVQLLKQLLDRATSALLLFTVQGLGQLRLELDLRYREATPSGGLFPEAGSAGNLPSGETYIVPYEGERLGDPSRSQGTLPVQFGEQVVLYEVVHNRAIRVLEGSDPGEAARTEARRLQQEPAYGNLAELGLGVLADFGLQPSGEILLDEKLGLHLAFGRSDHFGGQVGSGDFSSPDRVVHIDRVYLPALQPRVHITSLTLQTDNGAVPLMQDDRYVIDFGRSAPS